jgi:L-ascorbate metabolism protein UlaG (beta-lactamase superfamily)
MRIKFLGHTTFKITSNSGTSIITDPYHTDEGFLLSELNESANIVTVSHEHPDHNNAAAVQGNPKVVKNDANVEGIVFKTVLSYHDNVEGKERGSNLIFTFKVDDLCICHLGDLGHTLNAEQLAVLSHVDILMIPVGGGFTIDAAGATNVCDSIKPKVIIPMHYKSAGLQFLGDVDDFLNGKNNVILSNTSEMEFTKDTLPAAPQIIVLKPSHFTG